MDTSGKIIAFNQLLQWRDSPPITTKKVVVTNGCFDLLHAGHVHYLESARALGGLLLVGVNSDEAVRELKGPNRPINPEHDRARVLAALQCVDAVTVFPGVRATQFLQTASPDIYVKGGDYTLDTLDPGERKALEETGAEIQIVTFLPGRSTTAIAAKMRNGSKGS